MKNIILFTGSNNYRIEKAINDTIKEAKADELSLVKYDCEETLIEDIINDCETLPFLSDLKVVVVNNLIFLTSQKSKLEHNYDKLVSYLNNPNPSTIMILNASGINPDKKRKAVKLLYENAEVINHDKIVEKTAKEIIQKRLKELNITMGLEAVNELIVRTMCEEERIEAELEKISYYVGNKKDITLKEIKLLVSEPLETNVFNLSNNILEKKLDKAITVYHKLITQNEEPIMFSGILGKNFHNLYLIKQYQKQSVSLDELGSILKMHPYQLKILYQLAQNTKEEDIIKTINELAKYDIEVKSGRIDKYVGFELMMLKM